MLAITKITFKYFPLYNVYSKSSIFIDTDNDISVLLLLNLITFLINSVQCARQQQNGS